MNSITNYLGCEYLPRPVANLMRMTWMYN